MPASVATKDKVSTSCLNDSSRRERDLHVRRRLPISLRYPRTRRPIEPLVNDHKQQDIGSLFEIHTDNVFVGSQSAGARGTQDLFAVEVDFHLIVAANLEEEIVALPLGVEIAPGITDAEIDLPFQNVIEIQEELRGPVFLPGELALAGGHAVALEWLQVGFVGDMLGGQGGSGALTPRQ